MAATYRGQDLTAGSKNAFGYAGQAWLDETGVELITIPSI